MVQPNAGLPVLENMRAVYKQLPADMARGVPEALAAGANIIGSCCGSTPGTHPRHPRSNRGIQPQPLTHAPIPARRSSGAIREIGLHQGVIWRCHPFGLNQSIQRLPLNSASAWSMARMFCLGMPGLVPPPTDRIRAAVAAFFQDFERGGAHFLGRPAHPHFQGGSHYP